MINRSRFDLIRKKHGRYASWAVWAPAAATPNSNIGDLTVLDPDLHPSLLDMLRTDVIRVGLNFSRQLMEPSEPFRNFHDQRSQGKDFKLRHAFLNTPYWGAYMTDIIKNLELLTSSALRAHLKASPALIQANVRTFTEELGDIGATRPTILALGGDAYSLIAKHVPASVYGRIVRLMHYSNYISKEKYRDVVLGQIAASMPVGTISGTR